MAHAGLIAAEMPETLRDPEAWFDGRVEDFKCALQVAGEAAGLHLWRLKSFYCVLHPLDPDEEGPTTLDTAEELLAEEGSCLRRAAWEIILLEMCEPELRYFLLRKETHP